jgi:hypothetical protein
METIPEFIGRMLEGNAALWIIGATALYMAFLWMVTRLLLRTRESVWCPIEGRTASVTFLRGPDGFTTDVVRCSLLPPGTTCAKQCLHAA